MTRPDETRQRPHPKALTRRPPRPPARGLLRSVAIRQARRHLQTTSYPRLQMSLITLLTGAFGLLASFALLQAGLHEMVWRYPLAVVLAWGMFLFLIWLWLRSNVQDGLDLPDLTDLLPNTGRAGPDLPLPMRSGSGGDFGGGGASASFDAPGGIAMPQPLADTADLGEGVGEAVGEALGSVGDADELMVPLLALLLAVGLAAASIYLIYIAPTFLAEVTVDGALSVALFRHLRGQDPRHWLSTAVRRSALPFAATALLLAGCGAGLAAYAPGARTLSQALHHPAAP